MLLILAIQKVFAPVVDAAIVAMAAATVAAVAVTAAVVAA